MGGGGGSRWRERGAAEEASASRVGEIERARGQGEGMNIDRGTPWEKCKAENKNTQRHESCEM